MADILGKSDALNYDFSLNNLQDINPVSLGLGNNTPALTKPKMVNIPTYSQTSLPANNLSAKDEFWDLARNYEDNVIKDKELLGYTYNPANNSWTKPAGNPLSFNESHWLNRAKLFGFNSIDEVKLWQSKQGLQVDGMFGPKSELVWNQLNQLASQGGTNINTSNSGLNPQKSSDPFAWAKSLGLKGYTIKATGKEYYYHPKFGRIFADGKVFNPNTKQLGKFNNGEVTWNLKQFNLDNFSRRFGDGTLIRRNNKRFFRYDPDGAGDYLVGEDGKIYEAGVHGVPGEIAADAATSRARRVLKDLLNKIQTSYMQQGGKMNNQEEMQKAFMAFLILDAAEQGMQIQSEQDLQAYAEQLGEEGIKAKYQEFMQKMQGLTPAAKYGAKLNYLKQLKGECPEGYEVTYFKKGGMFRKGCKVCEAKKAMMQEGGDVKNNAITRFKLLKKHLQGGTFTEAFNAARALGNRFFSYNNKLYNTMTKLESSSAAGRKAWAQKFKDNSTYAGNSQINASQTGGWEGHKGYNAGRFDENGNWRQLKGKPTKWELRIVGYTEDKNGNIVPIKKWIGVNHKQYQGPVADVKNRNVYKSKTNDKKAGITYNADGTALDSTKKGTYKIVDNGKLKAPVAVGVTGNLPKPKPESPKNNPNAPLYKYNSADLIDIIMPTPSSVIGSLIGTAVTGKPQVAPSPINITGYVNDLANEDYLNFVTRAGDAYLTLGAPGASQFIRGVKLGSFVKPQPVSYTQFMGRNVNGTYKPLGLYKQQIGNLISDANEWSSKNLWGRFWSEKPQFGYYSTNVRNGMGRFTPMEESVKTGTKKAMDLFGYYVARPNVKAPNMDFTTFGAPAVSQYGATVGGLQDLWENEQ